MTHYCTYFDRGYLAVGLALWESLQRHEPDAVLHVLALDEDVASVLRARAEPGLRVLPLAELLVVDPELAMVQAGRPRQEFIFTLTPCLGRYLLRARPETSPLIYLDADLYFFGPPGAIRDEMGTGSIYLVPHRYPPWHDDAAYYGRFNVGVLGFRGDVNGLACLDWWRERCLESCELRDDGTAYGDQKYLDEWPSRFGGVVVSNHPGINFAPWNWAGHGVGITADGVTVDGHPLVVFHFAQFRRINDWWCDSGQLEYGIMPLGLRSRLYGEYWEALVRAEASIAAIRPDLPPLRRTWSTTLGSWRIALLRLFWGQCWLRVGNGWLAGRLGLGRFSGHAMGLYRRRQRGA